MSVLNSSTKSMNPFWGEKEEKMIEVSVSRCEMENNEVNSSVVLLELVNK